jgi:hypothetical protein
MFALTMPIHVRIRNYFVQLMFTNPRAEADVLRLTESALYFFNRMGAHGESDGPNDTGTRVRNWLRTFENMAAASDDFIAA